MKKSLRCAVFCASFALAALCGPAASAPGEIRVYSNICLDENTGDVAGSRIMMLDLGNDEIYGTYLEDTGVPAQPLITWLSPPAVEAYKKGRLALEFMGEDGRRKKVMSGTITPDAIVLSNGGYTPGGETATPRKPVHLARVKLPVRVPHCK